MIKNLTTNQLLLIALAAVLLLVAAFSFYLLQNPNGPLPFFPAPATSSSTPIVLIETPIPVTPTPTRRISYTPLFAFQTPILGTPSGSPSPVTSPGTMVPTSVPPTPVQPTPVGTQQLTRTPPSATTSATSSTSPTATSTLAAGEIGVTGRVVQNGTPVPNVVVSFADDTAPRQSTTNTGGHYSFITLAPGTDFILTFKQSNNSGLTPAAEIVSIGWIEGTLPANLNPIDLPDLEISLNLSGMLFNLIAPADGAAYSAGAINAANPIQFSWSLYSQGGSYSVALGPIGSDQPTWVSNQLAATSYMWDGTLTDGTHITAGSYWWRVAVKKSQGNYVVVLYTQPSDIVFNP